MPRVAAREREAYFEARQEEILEAALRVFARRGFDAASVEAVAAEAGLSKGTLYLYFPTKAALLEGLVQRYSLLPDVEALAADVRDRPLHEAVRMLVELAWRRLSENRDAIRLLLRELTTHLDHARFFMERVLLPTNRLFAGYLEAALGPRRAAELSVLVAGRGLLGMVLTLFVSQEILGGAELLPIPEDEITDTITELFLHGARGAGS